MGLAIAFLFLFLSVASVDGFYFHIYKYRLHARAESLYEHLLHTLNAVLLVPQVYLVFCVRPVGAWLHAAIALALVIYGIELTDVLCENDARRSLGGLTPVEYAMHFSMGGFRAAFLVAYFSGVSLADLTASPDRLAVPSWQLAFGLCLLVPATLVGILHVVLLVRGRREVERQLAAA